jgi:hypothetical protein
LVRCFAVVWILAVFVVPSQAVTILYSQNFENGIMPGQITGAKMLNTSAVPTMVGDGNWALYNDSGGTPQGTPGTPITLSLNGLNPFQSASLDFTFLAVDSWDGTDFGTFATDLFNIQTNSTLAFQASFRNYGYGYTHYTGDGSANYGSTMPANSKITLLLSDYNNYLVSHFNDAFYAIHLDGLHADAQGNLRISFFASGSGWQGYDDESFGIDNLLVTSPDAINPLGPEAPEPGTWITVSAGFALLLWFRRRKSAISS